MERLELDDYLGIAELILNTSAEQLLPAIDAGVAESALAAPFAGYGDQDPYPDPAVKAAILCSRLVRNHPLPDGNKRTALIAMLRFMQRNGITWRGPAQDEIAEMVERLAGKEPTLTEAEFVEWVRANVS